jgi:IS4 transposase
MQQAVRGIGKRLNRHFDRMVDKGVVTESNYNTRYTPIEIVRVLVFTAMLQTFVESAVARLRDVWHMTVPDADTIFRRLKEKREESLNALLSINREIIGDAKRKRWFRKRVTVAIDFWDREYYGKQRDINCSTGKERNGTRYFHRVATLAVVENGRRLEIAMIPVSLLAPKPKIVETLLREAMNYIRIRVVLLDRGFNSSGVIRAIEELGLNYIMPMTRNNRVKKEIDRTSGLYFRIVRDYQFRLRQKLTVSLLVVDSEFLGKKTQDYYLTYITNIRVRNSKGSVTTIAQFYEARWGIETGYRVKKWEFRAKTCSESVIVRFFFILLAIILFNIWTLLRFDYQDHYKDGTPAYILREIYIQMTISYTE